MAGLRFCSIGPMFAAGNGTLSGERIWIVTMTAGTRKIIVTQIHIRAAAHSWSWSGEVVKI